MKKLNFKIAVLFCMMIGFSSVAFGQVPSCYTIVKTHNDDITWYEVRNSTSDLGAFYNGKVIDWCSSNWTAVSYSHGYFFYQYQGKNTYFVYDKQGREVKNERGYHLLIDRYDVINGKLYMIRTCEVYDEYCKKIGVDFIEKDGITYLKTVENYKYGIKDMTNDEEIIAPEFDDCDCLGGDLFEFKMNGYWGVMNRQGKIIIPISRHYTSIDYSRTLKMYTFEKRENNVVYKGECNANGVQTSIAKVQTIKPQQPQQQAKQETKPQQPKQETVTPTPTPQPQPQPEPQPRQPQPFQVWETCFMCGGSGQCRYCYGYGWAANGKDACGICHGTGKCSQCAGHGGKNVIEYH